MSSLEILSGDFMVGTVRIRYSPAGRPFMRMTSRDGFIEDVFLETDVAACFDSSEGVVGEKLKVWASARGIVDQPARSPRAERVFAAVLKDGRRILGRSTYDVLTELKGAARQSREETVTVAPSRVVVRPNRASDITGRFGLARH